MHRRKVAAHRGKGRLVRDRAYRARMMALMATGGVAAWSPASLNPVLWVDPSYAGGRFQEITGAGATTPATAQNDPVGSVLNRGSAGGWMSAAATGQRPLLGLDDGSYFAPDNVDDTLSGDVAVIAGFAASGQQPFWTAAGWEQPSGGYIYGGPLWLNKTNLTTVGTFAIARGGTTTSFCVWAGGNQKLSATLATGKHSIVIWYDGTILHKSIDGVVTTQTINLTIGAITLAWAPRTSGKLWGTVAGYGTLSAGDVANLHAHYNAAMGV